MTDSQLLATGRIKDYIMWKQLTGKDKYGDEVLKLK